MEAKYILPRLTTAAYVYWTPSTERVMKVPSVTEFLVTRKYFFATDDKQHKVYKMDQHGVVMKTIGGRGSDPGQFSYPNGIRQKGNEIYVVDGGDNCQIQVFDEDLNRLRVFGKQGTDRGCFKSPTDLDFDESGNIYVVEQRNHRIQVLTPEGRHIRYIGSPGTKPGELDSPISPAIHRNMIYVSELGGRVSVFTLTGEFVTTFGHQLPRLECIAIDEDGYVHVTCNRKLLVTF